MFKALAWQGWSRCSSMPLNPTCCDPQPMFIVGTCTQSALTSHKHMYVQAWPSWSQTDTQRTHTNTSSATGLIFLPCLTKQGRGLLEGKFIHMYAQCRSVQQLGSDCPVAAPGSQASQELTQEFLEVPFQSIYWQRPPCTHQHTYILINH